MKDNIILEGQTYISAKRSSTITGYTTDYVGQLCRAGKLDCRMIGHTWYVSEKSLFKHRTESGGAFRETKSSQSFHEDDEKFISTNEARMISGYSSDYIGQLCRAGKLNCRRVGRAWFVAHKSLIEHKNSNEIKVKAESLEPSIIQSVMASAVTPAVEKPILTTSSIVSVHLDPALYADAPKVIAKPVVKPIAVTEPVTVSTSERHLSSYHFGRTALVISFICLIVIVSVGIFGHSLSSIGQLAFKSSNEHVLPPGETMLSSVGGSGLNGIAVAPSTNTAAGDEALKQQIRDSFTDKVNITSDQNGTAGVITPVFKKASDGSFVYVLVPVSDASKDTSQK